MCDVSPRAAVWIAAGSYLAAAAGTAVSVSLPHGHGHGLQAAVMAFLASGVIWMQRARRARGTRACMGPFRAYRLAVRERDSRRDDGEFNS